MGENCVNIGGEGDKTHETSPARISKLKGHVFREFKACEWAIFSAWAYSRGSK